MIIKKVKILIITIDNKTGFYTGDGFDTDIKKAHVYVKSVGLKIARSFLKEKNIKRIYLIPHNILIKNIGSYIKGESAIDYPVKRKNPINGSKKRRINKASNLFEEFTGHKANDFEVIEIPEYDVALRIGKCLGIMYETVRDGKKEAYCHEFKPTSSPTFAVSHDGQQIFILGGNYMFKDSGINDT